MPDDNTFGDRDFSNAKPLAIHADKSHVRALPTETRLAILDRLKSIAHDHGLEVLVCACKNPDIASGSCHISGRWPRVAVSVNQPVLFPL